MTREEWAERIYNVYPRKRAPRTGKKAIVSAITRNATKLTPSELFEITVSYNEYWKARLERNGKADIKHCPHITTWMNRDGFFEDFRDDEPPPEPPCEDNPYLGERI